MMATPPPPLLLLLKKKKTPNPTFLFSKFLILCSMTVIACLSGVELLLVVAEDVVDADSTAAALLFSAEMCLSILTLAADGIFY